MAYNVINAGAFTNVMFASFKSQLVDLSNGLLGFRWVGIATATSTPSAYLPLVVPAVNNGTANKAKTTLFANSYINSIIARPEGDVTLGAAAGTLKVATGADVTTSGLVAESAAASGGTLAKADFQTLNTTPVTVGASDIDFHLYATDGSNGASVVSAPEDTRIIVTISGFLFNDGLSNVRLVGDMPTVYSDSILSY